MAEQGVIYNRKLFVGGYDLSGDMNAISLAKVVEAKDNTRMNASAARTAIPGLLQTQFGASGLWDIDAADEPDDVIPGIMGVRGNVITVGLQTGAAGEACEFFRASGGNYRRFGNIGDILGFDLSAFLTNEQSIPGTIIANGSQSGTGNGTAYQVGAVAAGKSLYAALHVVAGTFGSITVKVQSDNASNFPSATDRVTFTAATQVGAQWVTPVAGAITDDWWRISVSALTGGPMTIVVAIGIL